MSTRAARINRRHQQSKALGFDAQVIRTGDVFETLGETTIGGRPGSRGIITGRKVDDFGEVDEDYFEVRMHSGNKGFIHVNLIQKV